jgi:HKD family nuclease
LTDYDRFYRLTDRIASPNILSIGNKAERTEKGKEMTRKDYIKIAKVISTAWVASQDFRESIANDFADMLEKDNPNFDREKFLTACGC